MLVAFLEKTFNSHLHPAILKLGVLKLGYGSLAPRSQARGSASAGSASDAEYHLKEGFPIFVVTIAASESIPRNRWWVDFISQGG